MLRAEGLQLLQNSAFDAAVDEHDPNALFRSLREDFSRRHTWDERLRVRAPNELGELAFGVVERSFAGGKRGPNGSVFAQRNRDRAGIRTDQRRHAVLVEPRRKALL